MRALRAAALTLLVASALVLSAGSPASGGGSRFLEVTKVVEGDGPTGGYVIEVSCTEAQGGSVFTLEFDDAGPGVPETQQVVVPGATEQCTVDEIEDNGADSVAYACDAQGATECVDDTTSSWNPQGVAGFAEFTVTNTFSDSPPPPPPPPGTSGDDVVPSAGGPVAASPGFTG